MSAAPYSYQPGGSQPVNYYQQPPPLPPQPQPQHQYQYQQLQPQPQPQPQPQRPSFNLDDLLGDGPSGQSAPPPPPPPPPPSYPPPPTVGDDPFTVDRSGARQQQPPQPLPQPHPQSAYTYAPTQPQQPQQPQQLQPLSQQAQTPAYYQPQPSATQPYAYEPQSQQPRPAQPTLEGAPHVWHPPPPQQAQQFQPQEPFSGAAYAPPAATSAGPTSGPFYPGFDPASVIARPSHSASVSQQPQQQQQQRAGYPAPPFRVPTALVGSDEDADRAHLEQIMRLRKELEREQEKEREKQEEKRTWPCPTCTFRNKLDLVMCDVCGAGRPGFSSSKVPQRDSSPPAATPKPASPQSPPAVPPGKWGCATCTFHNEDSYESCGMCGAPRPASKRPQQQPQSQQQRTVVDAQPLPRSGGGGGGTWACPTCTFENSLLSAARCVMCETPMPTEFAARAQVAQQQAKLLAGQGGSTYPAQQARSGRPPGAGHLPSSVASTIAAGTAGRRAAPTAAPTAAAAEDDVQWQDDSVVTNCNKCNSRFTLINRRHHCRACGFVFCHTCSSNKIKLKIDGVDERVCIDCYRERLSNPVLR